MRLWHYKLIPVLPNQMLVSQWRELIAIKRQWEKGTLKHRLVSYVMKYDTNYFLRYIRMVRGEMEKREINMNYKLYNEMWNFCIANCNNDIYLADNYPEHNDRYLRQCFFNLEEKYDRGIISKEEFEKIIELGYKEDIIE